MWAAIAVATLIAGETLSTSMRGVLDEGPAVPFTDVRRIMEEDLGRPFHSVFSTFEEVPFAAASLAGLTEGISTTRTRSSTSCGIKPLTLAGRSAATLEFFDDSPR